jgi:hypothetical protein
VCLEVDADYAFRGRVWRCGIGRRDGSSREVPREDKA